jgi:hypothetical protein
VARVVSKVANAANRAVSAAVNKAGREVAHKMDLQDAAIHGDKGPGRPKEISLANLGSKSMASKWMPIPTGCSREKNSSPKRTASRRLTSHKPMAKFRSTG